MNTADMSFDEMDDFMEYKVKKSGRHRKSRQPKLRNGAVENIQFYEEPTKKRAVKSKETDSNERKVN